MNNTPTSSKEDTIQAEIIKLGVDIHQRHYVVVRQIDGAAPQSPQKFTPEKFLAWAKKQTGLGKRVVSCYEAGCFGYVLHRRMLRMGIENLVVRPRNWDEYGSRVKTDKRDARELCSHLDRYLAGNTDALCVVRVPSEEEERERSLSRLRQTLAKEKQRLQNWGTSQGRYYGVSLPGNWWTAKVFAALREQIPDYLWHLLQPVQEVLIKTEEKLREATQREEKSAARALPVGLGALTASVLDKEIADYHRFHNRREVASYTGLCPGEDSSGTRRIQGSINKHGNPRIRHMLLEAVWRMFHFQPDYKPIVKWKKRMVQEPFNAARKKKMAVAIAREFAVDWWRLQTGRAKPEDLGLKMSLPSCASLRTWRNQQLQGMNN